MKKYIILYKKYLFVVLIIIISIIALTDLSKPGLPLTHDGQDHVARIANFYQNLSEGNIIPRWAGNLNWGYGHPILEFLYPLPSYLASLFHFFGFTLVDSVKLVFGTSFVLSGLAMYVFIKELLNDDKAAFFASALYIVAPYRFVDLYVRGAIGEHVAFIFPPLIFYCLIKLSRNYSHRYTLGGSLSLAGLILSHNAITLMFLPLIFLYGLYLVLQNKERKYFMLHTLYIILFGFGLSAFFWLPAFMEGKYTLRDIVTGGGEYAKSFVMWKDFFDLAWSYGGTAVLSKQIGFIHWIGIFGSIVSICILYRNKNKFWTLTLGSFFILGITLFLMTSSANPIWQTITILQKFQFPWRFLSITVLLSALLGGILVYLISNKYKKVALLIFVVGLLIVNRDYWHAQGFLQKHESFYKGIYNGTTDTGESSPIWSVRFMEKRPKGHIEVISGEASIKEISRNSTVHVYEINAVEKSRILENTLYFPGWSVFVDGKSEKIEFQDQNHRGLITFYVYRGKHLVNIIYEETKVRKFANAISLASVLTVAGLLILKFRVKKAYNKKMRKL